MNLEKIAEQGQQLQNTLSEIKVMRETWQLKKEEVASMLKEVARLPSFKPFSLSVRSYGLFQVADVVDIWFGKTPSGFVKKERDSVETMIKHGGSLSFHQFSTGRVWAIINYPSIDEVREKRQAEQLGEFSPEEITDDIVYGMVGKFLEKIIAWEKGILN